MLNLIKSLHTLIWLVMTMAVFYIGSSVIRMEFDTLFYVSFFLIASEVILIVVNSWKCPLTRVARRYTDDDTPNFDIFLPRIIAQYNKEIFTVILLAILMMYVINASK